MNIFLWGIYSGLIRRSTPKKPPPARLNTANAYTTTNPLTGTLTFIQVHPPSFADRELPLPNPACLLPKKIDLQIGDSIQDFQRVREGGGGKDPLLLQREKHGIGQVLFDGG